MVRKKVIIKEGYHSLLGGGKILFIMVWLYWTKERVRGYYLLGHKYVLFMLGKVL